MSTNPDFIERSPVTLVLPEPAGPPTSIKTHVVDRKTGKRMQIGGRLKHACDLIVWSGRPWNEAAQEAGLSVGAMRKALARPHVQTYLKTQREVFRASASGQNVHVAIAIRDQTENRAAALGALRYLDSLPEAELRAGGQPLRPGIVINIGAPRDLPRDVSLIEINEPIGDAVVSRDHREFAPEIED